ncbi:hypothetical protein [Mycoplasma suis]|uniref:Uncharacterized protein n=2 Tax=Mycoplasma suis TaxID=57372 RepID=F0QRL1_MYCSL|nr:hypothetical protein [Mycoplasma suis]ADX98131.1 hypothetical protein MSU_0599 [Mycoplasma suis str. Illinois]CBZ40653.1 hypothetical protein MSUIS_05600 [Mycoplasma suis KI3806]
MAAWVKGLIFAMAIIGSGGAVVGSNYLVKGGTNTKNRNQEQERSNFENSDALMTKEEREGRCWTKVKWKGKYHYEKITKYCF